MAFPALFPLLFTAFSTFSATTLTFFTLKWRELNQQVQTLVEQQRLKAVETAATSVNDLLHPLKQWLKPIGRYAFRGWCVSTVLQVVGIVTSSLLGYYCLLEVKSLRRELELQGRERRKMGSDFLLTTSVDDDPHHVDSGAAESANKGSYQGTEDISPGTEELPPAEILPDADQHISLLQAANHKHTRDAHRAVVKLQIKSSADEDEVGGCCMAASGEREVGKLHDKLVSSVKTEDLTVTEDSHSTTTSE
ncbi:unnamed protein product [Amoebophrya sp. A120]|nr:unnamed protein product [Amoebophrya sp. A120]|eukprot:GSA120T00007371001.1